MHNFDIPIVFFIFKRAEKSSIIIDQIAKIKPKKIYLIADGPRSPDEKLAVDNCRKTVEEHITWDCEVIKNYSDKNRGVYLNIAGGAKWVFEREQKAIFLEDDNFPDISFFSYCKELLQKYEDDTRILWICGTNYLMKTKPTDGSDYFYTKLMLPCGWASWSNKFNRFYDGEIQLFRVSAIKLKIKKEYKNGLLFDHDYGPWLKIINDIDTGKLPNSWDYQMAFALRANNLFGIAPKYNLIRNIGADSDSIHGGVSLENIMTKRFCEVPTYELTFPLKHPPALLVDPYLEKKLEKIIILPLKYRIKGKIITIIKRLFGISQEKSLSKELKSKYFRK